MAKIAGEFVEGTAYQDAENAYVAIKVEVKKGDFVEFNCSTPLAVDGESKSAKQITQDLIADAKRQLEAQAPAVKTLDGLNGKFTM